MEKALKDVPTIGIVPISPVMVVSCHPYWQRVFAGARFAGIWTSLLFFNAFGDAFGVTTKLTERNTTFLTKEGQAFTTYADNQPGILTGALEGDGRSARAILCH